ncbi:MAG: hypothetical protein RR382_00310 [Tannerellaceae bacterium]
MSAYTLTRSTAIERDTACGSHVYVLQVVCTSLDGRDPNVFVYHEGMPTDPIHGDLFSNVASLSDMNEIPFKKTVLALGTTVLALQPRELLGVDSVAAGVDTSTTTIPYYRTTDVTLELPNMMEYERCWNIIVKDVMALASNQDAYKRTHQDQTINI